MRKLEIACFNRESARIAAASGADRIELCSGFAFGGLTPSPDDVAALRREISIPLFVMIRPHGRGFHYTDAEFRTMKSDIERLGDVADGFVFGMLTASGDVDPGNAELVASAQKPCTFHRAFDQTNDLPASLETIIGQGFSTVLTSGGKGNAADNPESLKRLVAQAGDRIAVMPGGGVRSKNVETLIPTGARWFHSSGIVAGECADAGEITALKRQLFL